MSPAPPATLMLEPAEESTALASQTSCSASERMATWRSAPVPVAMRWLIRVMGIGATGRKVAWTELHAYRVRGERTRLTEALQQRGLDVLPSQANFVLTRVPDQPGARAVYEELGDRGILVRYFNEPGLDDKLRITVGTPDHDAMRADSSLLAMPPVPPVEAPLAMSMIAPSTAETSIVSSPYSRS